MKKIFSIFAAILFAGSMMATVKEYTLTIDENNFTTLSSGSGYAAYNGEHTFTATATDASTMEVKIVSNQVMISSNKVQGQKSNGYLYNTTNLGSITSITFNNPNSNAFSQIIGSAEHPNSASANGAYFTINASSSGASAVESITITFKKDDAIPVTGISLDVTSKYIEVGESFQLTATIAPADAANPNVVWSCASTKATVDENGVVTGLAEGSATIWAKSAENESISASCDVTIGAAVPSDYVETAFNQIKTQDEVVITMTIDSVAKTFALNGDNATGSAPKADLLRIVGTSVKPVTAAHIFTVSAVTGGYQFALKSDASKVLYAFAAKSGTTEDGQNNDIRVGTVSGTASGVWNLDANNHLYTTPASDARYLCVYTSSDWRSYKSTSGGYANVTAQTLKFYVKSVGGDPIATAIDNTAEEAKVVKTIENGQLVIIKNGVKYNAQGTQIR